VSNRKGHAQVLFATSNRAKLEEARVILAPFGISLRSYDGKGIEIQADTNAEVASYASRSAALKAGGPVIVEDAGLYVQSLGGFPGPYSAYVFKTIGTKGVGSLLQTAARQTERTAAFVSSVAYCEPGREPVLFEGKVEGTVAKNPRGDRGFGFDPIFVPKRGSRTFGELTLQEKCRVSHRGIAMRRFAEWFLSRDRR